MQFRLTFQVQLKAECSYFCATDGEQAQKLLDWLSLDEVSGLVNKIEQIER